MIITTGQEAASNGNVLTATRLQTIGVGLLVIEFQASVATPTNNHSVSVQLPSGDTPANGVIAPADGTAVVGVLDERTMIRMEFIIRQLMTGHLVFSTVLTGASTLTWRISASRS